MMCRSMATCNLEFRFCLRLVALMRKNPSLLDAWCHVISSLQSHRQEATDKGGREYREVADLRSIFHHGEGLGHDEVAVGAEQLEYAYRARISFYSLIRFDLEQVRKWQVDRTYLIVVAVHLGFLVPGSHTIKNCNG